MVKYRNTVIFFTSGSIGYGAIELLWRGRTHWTMLIAGGICFVLFSKIAEKYRRRKLLLKGVLCALSVTCVELVFGIVFNIIFKMQVWDYSNLPFNLFGQICARYSFFWCILGCAAMPVIDAMNRKIAKLH